MSSRDLISMGVRNLIKRKLRTFLTVLGVMIGTASIVVMVSLGLAINEQFARQMEQVSDMTLITVNSWSGRFYSIDEFGNESVGEQKMPSINDETMAEIETIPGVQVATPVLEGPLYFKSGEYILSTWCLGVKPEAMPLLGMTVKSGQLLTSESEDTDIVFGAYAEANFRKGNRYEDRYWEAMMTPDTYEPYVDVMEDKIRMSPDSELINTEEAKASVDVKPDDMEMSKMIKPYEVNVVGL